VHGAGFATKAGHGFTTNSGDQTVTMFDLKTLAVLKQIKVGPGLDGIMYDEPDDKIILTNHSRPIGTLTAIDPATGDIVATVELEDTAPEGAAADGKGHIFVNNESKNTIQVIDVKTWKATASWPIAPCDGPTASPTTRRRTASSPAAARRRSSSTPARGKWSHPSPTARASTPSAGTRRRS
jgi:DNA-binding beta-propeller fold protein YncE